MTAHQVTESEMLNGIIDLLKDSGLPYKDISLEKSLMFSYLNDHGNIIGSGGLEFYGPYALLRSVAVRKDLQGKAIGKRIVNDLFEKAKEKNATAIYLLTESAHEYFSRLQFKDVDRSNVPQEIRSSSEFSNVCPTSAACMVYDLT
jgi:amino-acid N-acetyltransferase